MIVTMEEKGSYLIKEEQEIHIPAHKVHPVDTTAAGDSYIAAFAVGVSKGMNEEKAAKFASKVSAIVVTREGAQPSLPTLEEVRQFQ
ncbi:PfkB family carbohydrate kinase [Rossellomorea aquimaris]|uniref:PfkB family carbohydrate kinase n=1 Tax=Rossellomorea aquimaris TaxID=189382 RepID=UPI0024957867|nr:PfkB family carbohydrate kinase [Rossellomorea aquimaris]